MTSTKKQGNFGPLKTVIFSIIPLLLFLVVAEGSLRLYASFKAVGERGVALPQPAQRHEYQREDPVLGYSLKPGYEGGDIRVNQLGFRGPEVSIEKPKNVLRIVAIGDSTTFGLAGEGCPYPAQLEGLLNSNRETPRFEVINAGVEGYSSIYALRLIETRIAQLEPDLVIIYVGWNDLYSTWPFQPNLPRPPPGGSRKEGLVGSLRSWLDNLYLVQFMRRVIYKGIPRILAYVSTDISADAKEPHPKMAETYKEYLRRMIVEVQSIGARPMLLTLPTVVSPQMSQKGVSILHYPTWARGNYKTFHGVIAAYNNAIRDVAREKDVLLIDNAEYVDSFSEKKEELFFDSLHMYCEGYALLAQNIRDQLRASKIIDSQLMNK
jgi:lysophospholipase L1-like esterase